MYKLILADDEALIRNNMKKGVPWEKYGFQLINCCRNGREVLETMEREIPDLVITDITMPGMDGIEVAKRISEDYPKVKIVFLSGYNEFEYARKALQYGVKQYLLKPVDGADMQELLQDMKELLDQERLKTGNRLRMEKFYEENKELMKNVLINQILSGDIDAEKGAVRVSMLGLEELQSFKFQVANVSVCLEEGEQEEEREQKKTIVFEQLGKFLEKEHMGFACMGKDGCDILLCSCGCRTEKIKEEFELFLNRICIGLKEKSGVTVTIGVGSICDCLEQVSSSCEDARKALEYQDLVGIGKVIFLDDIEAYRSMEHRMPEDVAYRIIRMVKMGNRSGLETEIEHYKKQMRAVGFEIEIVCMKMLDIVSRVYELDVQLSGEADGIQFRNTVEKMIGFQQMEEIVEEVLVFCRSVQKKIADKRERYSHGIIRKAKEIVDRSYADFQFGIDEICTELGLSKSYFRSVFKKEVGMSFGSYLRHVRMREARKLVLHTELLNYEIAERVGYVDSGYFGYCFKKFYHQSPGEMRQSEKRAGSSENSHIS